MLRPLLALGLLAASAGLARADEAPQNSVAVKIAGLSPQAARTALRAAAHQVCQNADLDDVNGPIDCYNTALRTALDQLQHVEHSQVAARATQTASR